MTSILVFHHQPYSGPGALEVPLRRAGFELDFWFPSEASRPSLHGIAGIISLGGLASPEDTAKEPWLAEERTLIGDALARATPFLGICLGAQLLALEGGGSVEPASEHGWTRVDPATADVDDPILEALAAPCEVFQWHDWAFRAPADARVLATSDSVQQAFRVGDRAWGVQFHLELTLSIAAQWMVVSRDTLVEHGVDPDALRAETAEREGEWLARADRVAAQFGRLCRGG
jgi:GMP synthase (glutamine-hydrolysing)